MKIKLDEEIAKCERMMAGCVSSKQELEQVNCSIDQQTYWYWQVRKATLSEVAEWIR